MVDPDERKCILCETLRDEHHSPGTDIVMEEYMRSHASEQGKLRLFEWWFICRHFLRGSSHRRWTSYSFLRLFLLYFCDWNKKWTILARINELHQKGHEFDPIGRIEVKNVFDCVFGMETPYYVDTKNIGAHVVLHNIVFVNEHFNTRGRIDYGMRDTLLALAKKDESSFFGVALRRNVLFSDARNRNLLFGIFSAIVLVALLLLLVKYN